MFALAYRIAAPVLVLSCAPAVFPAAAQSSSLLRSSSVLRSDHEASLIGDAALIAPVPVVRRRDLKPEAHAAMAFETHVGLSGPGGSIARPLGRHFTVRTGADMIRYTGQFQEDGATINAALRLGYMKSQVDWFPMGGRFHISPLMVFGNNTRVSADVLLDPAQQFDLNGRQFRSSAADPLHGSARVDTAHTAPGLTMGFGNLTRGRGHFSFPAEIGFFYTGQPKLQVHFTGTACDPSQPPATGCMRVQDNADFVSSLNSFIARNNRNLSYAKFMPILSFGVGYRFGHSSRDHASFSGLSTTSKLRRPTHLNDGESVIQAGQPDPSSRQW